MKAKLRLLLSFPIFFFCFSLFPQDGLRLWEETADIGAEAASQLSDGRGYRLEETRLENALAGIQQVSGTQRLLYFPDANGKMIPYRVEERSVMASELQERYPGIRSYVGYGVGEHVGKRIRFSWSQKGFQAMISAPGDPSLSKRYRTKKRPMFYMHGIRNWTEHRPGNAQPPLPWKSLLHKTRQRSWWTIAC